MGISHAFDNKVDEKSFFETGIDEKPSIIIEFNNPVNYFTYEFFSGKSETRLQQNGFWNILIIMNG